ncbi:hypothetical protein Vadar_001937 [Vaccinium darrowii]|uniref:Uncharacterized protein n=1 Tax=Vaccinium darrowii TaxID=229202 RepID=A0ACB7WWX7_9ERIC|nr:hypothetical protein Vadar_001937 [Vaccinium darrowii]
MCGHHGHKLATRILGCGNLRGYASRDCYLPKRRSSLVADDRCIALAFLISQWAWAVLASRKECYLVNPASSHMLVSKIKPCMCKGMVAMVPPLPFIHTWQGKVWLPRSLPSLSSMLGKAMWLLHAWQCNEVAPPRLAMQCGCLKLGKAMWLPHAWHLPSVDQARQSWLPPR